MTVRILVDGKQIEATEGASLLTTCLDNGIFIPNLCHVKGMSHPPASCRLCFVSVNGAAEPVTACTTPVTGEMAVQTDTPAVRRLQKSALRFLLSVHHVDCKNCHANKACALQDLARFLGVGLKSKQLSIYLKEKAIDDHHPCLTHFPNRCVLCCRCIHVCGERHGMAGFSLAKRGFETMISFYGMASEADAPCPDCLACAGICPVGALIPKQE